MSDTHLNRAFAPTGETHTQTLGETVIRRTLYSTIFLGSLPFLAVGRLVRGAAAGSLFSEARQAAHATVGYALKH